MTERPKSVTRIPLPFPSYAGPGLDGKKPPLSKISGKPPPTAGELRYNKNKYQKSNQPRQRWFENHLKTIAVAIESYHVPWCLEYQNGERRQLDQGAVGIAIANGFLVKPLDDKVLWSVELCDLTVEGQDAKQEIERYDARTRSIREMANTVEQTVGNANGQVVERTVKIKELRMSRPELEKLIDELMTTKKNRCALTDIALQFHDDHQDDQLLPSLDRIDSNGHYEASNLQVVCRFVNFWKGDSANGEFLRLLGLIRGTAATK